MDDWDDNCIGEVGKFGAFEVKGSQFGYSLWLCALCFHVFQ